MDMEKCGAFIRQCRTERGLSQQQLARELHVTREAVSKWENARGFPDVSLLQPLAEALGVSVSELLLAERGERDEEALYSWIFLTEFEQKLQRKNSARLLLTVGVLILAHYAGLSWLILPLCILAVALPLALALNGKFSLGSIVLSSFGCCFAVVISEWEGVRRRVLVRDWAGLGDTIDVTVTVCVVLIVATMLVNALVLSGRKK